MIEAWLWRALIAPAWLRWLLVGLLALAMCLVWYLAGDRPWQAAAQREQHYCTQRHHYARLFRQLARQPTRQALDEQQRQQQQELQQLRRTTLSLPLLLKASGAQLLSWQRLGSRHELQLALRWDSLSPLMKTLWLQLPTAQVASLTLQAQAGELNIVLQLELAHEDDAAADAVAE